MPFKLLRSPSSTTNQSKNSRLSFNFFYFAAGDTQKDSGLEIEFLLDLDTGASSSIINYRTFREICQTQHPITVKKSTTQTRTYSGQVVHLIGFATLTFSCDPDGHFFFPLTVWITERLKTSWVWTSVKSRYLASILIYLELNLKSHQTLCVMEVFIRTNSTLSFRRF